MIFNEPPVHEDVKEVIVLQNIMSNDPSSGRLPSDFDVFDDLVKMLLQARPTCISRVHNS